MLRIERTPRHGCSLDLSRVKLRWFFLARGDRLHSTSLATVGVRSRVHWWSWTGHGPFSNIYGFLIRDLGDVKPECDVTQSIHVGINIVYKFSRRFDFVFDSRMCNWIALHLAFQ